MNKRFVIFMVVAVVILISGFCILQKMENKKETNVVSKPSISNEESKEEAKKDNPVSETQITAESANSIDSDEKIIEAYRSISNKPRNEINGFIYSCYGYDTDDRPYWADADLYMTEECLAKFKPSMPSDNSRKPIRTISEVNEVDIYFSFYDEREGDALILVDYYETIGTQSREFYDCLKIKIEKFDKQWLISDIERISRQAVNK